MMMKFIRFMVILITIITSIIADIREIHFTLIITFVFLSTLFVLIVLQVD